MSEPKERNRGAPTPAPFALPGEQAEVMRDAYYRQLNEHAPFTAALDALRTRLAIRFPAEGIRRPKYNEHDNHEPSGPWRAEDAWLSETARGELLAFAKQWRLPSLGHLDVLKGLRFSPPNALPRILADHSPKIGAVPYAFISADQPEMFLYDPVISSGEARRKAKAAGEAVRRQMLDQIERAEDEWRRAGRKPLPPRTQSTADLDEGAHRLLQRAVLGWTWSAITDDAAKRERAYDETAIREGVKSWAQEIGLTLPAD